MANEKLQAALEEIAENLDSLHGREYTRLVGYGACIKGIAIVLSKAGVSEQTSGPILGILACLWADAMRLRGHDPNNKVFCADLFRDVESILEQRKHGD